VYLFSLFFFNSFALCFRNYTKKKLWLDIKLLGDDGAKSLGAFFSKNCSLQYLNVGFNAIGDIGLASFLSGLLMELKDEHAVVKVKQATALKLPSVVTSGGGESATATGSAVVPNATSDMTDGGGDSKKDDHSQAGSKGEDDDDDEDDEDEEEDDEEDEEEAEEEEEEEEEVAADDDKSKENHGALATVAEGDEDNQLALIDAEKKDSESKNGDESSKKDDDDEEEKDDVGEDDGMEVQILEVDKNAEKRIIPKDDQEEKLLKLKGPPPLLELDISGNYLGKHAYMGGFQNSISYLETKCKTIWS
jgi:hypothetical protein